MSDGLFRQDPPYRAERLKTQHQDQEAAPVAPAVAESRDEAATRIEEIDQPRDNDTDTAASSASTAVISDAVGASTQRGSTNDSSWLGGLTQDQPAHYPAAVTTAAATKPVGAEDIPPFETEAAFPFRVIGRMSSALTGPTAIALLLAVGGLLALYIYFQVLSLLAMLGMLPTWLATIAVVLLCCLIAVVLYAFYCCASAYTRLSRNEQILISDIEQLERHAQIRRGCSPSQQRQQAKAVLEDYVRGYPQYPLKTNAPRRANALPAAQPSPHPTSPFSTEELAQLYRTQGRLADPARVKDSKEWLNIYATDFQSVLDNVAHERVHKCAKWVGYKTAISPNSLVDTLITVYWCFILLRDLCVIYNVRVGSYGTAALLWRAFFTAYLAGKFQDWEDHADYTIESMMDGLPEIGRKLAGKLAAKAGSGLANYFMVRRLGRRAIALLRPLAVQ